MVLNLFGHAKNWAKKTPHTHTIERRRKKTAASCYKNKELVQNSLLSCLHRSDLTGCVDYYNHHEKINGFLILDSGYVIRLSHTHNCLLFKNRCETFPACKWWNEYKGGLRMRHVRSLFLLVAAINEEEQLFVNKNMYIFSHHKRPWRPSKPLNVSSSSSSSAFMLALFYRLYAYTRFFFLLFGGRAMKKRWKWRKNSTTQAKRMRWWCGCDSSSTCVFQRIYINFN